MKSENQVKIKDRIAKKIYKLSKETKKDISYHTNKALENYLDDIDDLKEAVKRENDKIITSKELRKQLGL